MEDETKEKVDLLGCQVDIVSLDELLNYIIKIIHERRKAIIAYINIHALNLSVQYPWFRNFINESQLVYCDGVGVKWTVKLLTGKHMQRFTPPDWFENFASQCSLQGFSMFFLGTRQVVVEKAAEKLKESNPRIEIVGVHHGFFDKELTSSENQYVLAMINKLKPDILIVGFGMPIQEKWIQENWNNLDVYVVIPVGAFFDYLANEVARAPRWITNYGFEWLGRLIIEPKRLWKRYIFGIPFYFFRIFLYHVLKFPLKS